MGHEGRKGRRFQASLSYIASLKSAWATRNASKSEERRNERQEKRKRRMEGTGTLPEKVRSPRTNYTKSRGGFTGMHGLNGRLRTVKKTKHRPTIQRLVQPGNSKLPNYYGRQEVFK